MGPVPDFSSAPTPHQPITPALDKKRAGLLRLSGDEVAYALTRALRRVMRPT